MTVGQKLKQWMAMERMNQKALADALDMSESTVSLFVNDVREPSGEFRWRFAERYGFGTAKLIFNGTAEAAQ